MSISITNALEAATYYISRGYAPIPVTSREKNPKLKKWTKLRVTNKTVDDFFRADDNVGLLLGEPSGWLVDIDLDCEEAVLLASKYLPPTEAKTGRASSPDSHWWYMCEGAVTKKHCFPGTKETIAEIRSTGAQTLVGPSVHPCGERYETLLGEPAVVACTDLVAALKALVKGVIESRTIRMGQVTTCPALQHTIPNPNLKQLLHRATLYLDQMPAAISGSGGHDQTFAAATAMVHGFGLDPDTAFKVLSERYNPRCIPQWSENELRHKVNEAATKPHEKPMGWLRDAKLCDGSGAGGPSTVQVLEDPFDADDDSPVDPGPLPEHFLEVPGFIGEVMAFNKATAHRWQPLLALAGAISLQAVLAGRKVRDERGNRTNLYILCIAGSGAGKDHARQVNKAILHHAGLDSLEGNEDIASDSGLLAAVAEQPSILFQIDEFGRFLRSIADSKKSPHLFNIASTLMRLFSSAKTTFKGKAYANPTQNKHINQPCVSLLATTAPDHFRQALTQEAMSDGFMARLLVFESTVMPPRVWRNEMEVPKSILEGATWWANFHSSSGVSNGHSEPITIRTTEKAKEVFNNLSRHSDHESESQGDDVQSVRARTEEKASRLALVYACSKNREAPVIDEDAAEWACGLAEHLTRRVLFLAHEYVTHGEFDAKQKALLRGIRKAGGKVSGSKLCRLTQHFTPREREEVIKNLMETGRLREVETKTAGRPRKDFYLTETLRQT